MRELVVLVDGADSDPLAPAVRPLDPGLLGHGVYESIRTYDGVPFGLDEHLERLAAGAAALVIPCPTADLAREVEEAVRLRAAAGETRIRVFVTAGGTRVVIADDLPDRRLEREEGLAAVILPWPRDPAGPTAGVKASSTAASRVGQRYAVEHGAATGIWVTPAGKVSEALAANVFAVIDGVVVTPPLSDGALAGVTRSKILRFAADEGVECAERSLTVAGLAAAPEAFVSATSEPVVPLVLLDGSPIGDGTPGPVTARLQELFDRRARGG
jgi:branched-subunit amino acid aminotransferase/4-amino-4-deoxychorismate lyase